MPKRIALKNGKFKEVEDKDIQYEFDDPSQFFGNAVNLLPMQNAVSSARAFYSEKFSNQAIALKNGEAPYVQSLKDPKNNTSFQEYMGRKTGVVEADDDAEIIKVTPDLIEYKDSKGKLHSKELYNNFIFNRKSSLTNIPLVKKGDKVKKGAVLAKTNYTDDNGVLNMGLNARVGFVPYKGWTLDDAIVISEDFAKRLTSQHAYQFTEDEADEVKTNKIHFASLFPKTYTKDQLDTIDDNGIVKIGTKLVKGSPLILSTKPRIISSRDNSLGKLSKYLKNTKTDASIQWDQDNDAIVTDVIKGKNGWKVIVEAYSPAKPGDKLTQRPGNKGTISKIIPNELMPRTKDGKPLDALINPLGIPSRVNSAILYEALLGKVVEKTGVPYKLPSFNNKEKWYDFVKSELDKNGLSDTEDIYDPESGKLLERPVTVGNLYIQKLHHTGESKLSARGQGIYDANLQPSKGGEEGQNAKRLSALENYCLLAAGAYNVIKDGLSLRGQKNDEYWRAVREGQTPELAKKSPFVWDKFIAMMQGAGINALDKGNGILRAAPFTDKALESYNPIELKNADIIDIKTLQPVKDGLFDPATSITNKWAKITLSEPVINPPFENMVASLLGIKKSDMYDIMAGKKDLESYGTGAVAIQKALEGINVRKMFNEASKDFKTGPKSGKQKALNRMNYIKGMLRTGIEPKDLVITKIPVIPPAFRPYSIMGDTFIPGDVNELYKEVFNVNKAHKELKDELGSKEANEDTMNLYNSVKALYGISDPENKKLKQRGVSGFMQKLVGGTSKFSFLQRAVTSKTVDFTGRSVIGVNPDLSMDEIGIPYDIAWKMFSPYIQRELSKNGMKLSDAVVNIEQRSDIAKRALEKVVKERPILYSRAPAWHKFNTLGGWAKLHDGKNILINPLVTTGLNADFDGDYQLGYVYVAIKKS